MAERITLRQATLQLLDKTEGSASIVDLVLLARRQIILLDEIAQRLERYELERFAEWPKQ